MTYPRRLLGKSEFFRRPLPTEAVAALVENLTEGRAAGESRELDFTPWGGAYNRVPTDAIAFTHREELFLLQHVVTVGLDAQATGGRPPGAGWRGRGGSLARPWGSVGVYPNFPDPDLEDWARAYHGVNLGRLTRAKARYAPDNFFRFHQSVPAGAPA